jgi:hypothetical protein
MPSPSYPSTPSGGGPSPIPQKTPLQDQTIAQLRAEADSLENTIRTTSDLAIYRAANDEYGAVQDRISTLLNLQLAADSADMQNLGPGIKKAKEDLDKVLSNISKASDVITACAKFLGVIDEFVTAAKVAASII